MVNFAEVEDRGRAAEKQLEPAEPKTDRYSKACACGGSWRWGRRAGIAVSRTSVGEAEVPPAIFRRPHT